MNFKSPYPDHTIMDIPERDNMLNALNLFEKNKTGQAEQDQLFDALNAYVGFLLNYCSAELGGKTYSFDHVVPQLFELEIKKEQQWKQYLKCSLYALRCYLECLRKYKLHRNNVRQYRSLILMLASDVEWLLANYEVSCKKSVAQVECTCGATRQLSTSDLVFAMNELFFIDDCDDLASFDMRDVKPNFMFIVRQFLETVGNNLIGFSRIVDDKKRPIHKLTQISWEYLTQSTVAKQNVSLPFLASTIHKVSQWANSFVHARHLHACYIQFYALDFINHLMTAPKNHVRCHDGRNHYNILYGDFRIEHYDALKADFETFVKSKHPHATVQWLPLDKVGACIISLP
ncbi:MAG: hypothetical protein J1E37_03255 [Prevotella sp.]|nr:hypothetical protein [Prevotella sp.]